MLALIAVAAFLTFILYVVLPLRKPNNFPPGPAWLPLFGCASFFKSLSRKLGGQHLAYVELGNMYKTDVLGMKLGNDLVVTVGSYDTIRDVLRSDDYNARPDSFFIKLRTMGTKRGIVSTDGELWATHRTFLIRHLRDLGLGKRKMDALIVDELREVLKIIEMSKSGIKVGRILSPGVLNILWALIMGKRIPNDNQTLNKLLELLSTRGKSFDMAGGWLGLFPWLRFIMPEQTGYNLILRLNDELRDFLMKYINEHLSTWKDGMDDDFIYAYITEMKKDEDSSFTIEQLVAVCLDIFFGGAQTTSITVDFAILMMILHPEIQEKVHATLDAAFGDTDIVEYRHRQMVPYVEAVLFEVERFYHATPITGPRRALRNTKIGGYDIPKNTTIFLNNYALHHDPEIWGDPEEFRPERFLDENNQVILNHKYLMTFNIGRRRCLGEVLARSCAFTFFVGIMRKFKIGIQEGTPYPTGVPIPGILIHPEHYVASFEKRKK